MAFADTIAAYKTAIAKGDSLAVIDRFYDDTIVQVENNEAPIQGKKALLDLEKASLERVNSFSNTITSMLIDENSQKTMGEMLVKFDSKKSGKKKFCEAFVQHWQNNKIIYQRFYYGPIEEDN